jgi:hypothetical protein
LVIALNQGMPVKIPAEWKNQTWTQPTVKHHPQQSDDKLRVLSDIIVLKDPYDTVLSFGDLILAVGLCDLAYNASRKPKKKRSPVPAPMNLVESEPASGDLPPSLAMTRR